MQKTYTIKEIFFTFQGEGMQTGRPAVFCRFSGCNLWTGLEKDRASATCNFCDTDFRGTDGTEGGKYHAESLAQKVAELWPHDDRGSRRYVVCTGGEPLLQLDKELIDAFHVQGFEVAIETNGTRKAPEGLDWICMSPKPNTDLKLISGDEIKLVYPQPALTPEQFSHLDFRYFFLQPMDGPDLVKNTQMTLNYCRNHPQWRVSIQTHKYVGIR